MSVLQEIQKHGFAKCDFNDALLEEAQKPFFAVFDNLLPVITPDSRPVGAQTYPELIEKAKQYQQEMGISQENWCMPRVLEDEAVIGLMRWDGSLFEV